MSVKPYASDLIRSMRGKLRDAGHGGLVLRSEDAIEWERSLNTILALVEELEEEKTSLERRLDGASRERTEAENIVQFRPRHRRFHVVTSPNDGGSAA